jgi:hypothetical protein
LCFFRQWSIGRRWILFFAEGYTLMRVNGADGSELTGLEGLPTANPGVPGGRQNISGSADACLQADCAGLIQQAVSARSDADAPARARQLLACGWLDSPEAARAAAAKILEQGI